MTADSSRVVAGVCDQPCDDLDLVPSRDGTAVHGNTEGDAEPRFMVTGEGGTRDTLTVRMEDCRAAACGYHYRVFRIPERTMVGLLTATAKVLRRSAATSRSSQSSSRRATGRTT